MKFLFALIFLCFAASCATPISALQSLSQQESQLKIKGSYESYLALEYLMFSRNLATIKNQKNSEYFAKKGLAVIAGKDVVPENPLIWKADKSQIEEMILTQKRLEDVLIEPYMKFRLPIQMAHLTYLYDCWISRESKAIFRADELAQCRVRFGKLLDEIEDYIDDLKKDKQPKVEIKEPEFERFKILFDLSSYKFNDKASQDLLEILKHLKSLNGNYRVLLVGNADRLGLEISNENLALNRLETTKNHLIKNGVNAGLIELRSMGEDFPDIITKNGVANQQNRSVGIYVLKGFGTFSSFPLPLIENYVYAAEIKKAREAQGLKN